ncbi:MAG: universal stress protein [Anaerolineaceae bacterium]|jgi:nucleotide-binding universal stress UspA family protein
MFEKILLTLDGSALAEKAIPHAIEFARIFNSRIFLLHVLQSEPGMESAVHTEPLNWQLHKAKTENYLHGIANQIRSSLGLAESEDETDCDSQVTVKILEGKVAENIVDFAHDEKIDLLVISSHGSGGLSRWNLNSVTLKVVSLIYTPVLIIRSNQTDEVEPTEIRYERILLPVDGSRRSECSLTAGITIAHYCQSKVIIASIITPPEISAIDPYNQELQALNTQYLELSRKIVRQKMEEISSRFEGDTEVRIIEAPHVYKAIVNLVKEEKIDLLIFCAHGQTGELTLPFGTTARTFIEYSPKPVLIIQDLSHNEVPPTPASQATDPTRSRF